MSAFARQSVTVTPGGKTVSLVGNFDWFAIEYTQSSPLQVAKDLGGLNSVRVLVQVRSGPNDVLTSLGFFSVGDVLRCPFYELVLSLPVESVRDSHFDVLRGMGELVRNPLNRQAGKQVVTPRGQWESDGAYTQGFGIGSTVVVSEVLNVAGVRLSNIILTAQGDAAVFAGEALVLATVGASAIPIAQLTCAIGAGPVSIIVPDIEVPPLTGITLVTGSDKSYAFCARKLL